MRRAITLRPRSINTHLHFDRGSGNWRLLVSRKPGNLREKGVIRMSRDELFARFGSQTRWFTPHVVMRVADDEVSNQIAQKGKTEKGCFAIPNTVL